MPVVSPDVEGPHFALEFTFDAVLVEHGVPALAVVGRFDQRKGEVAQGALLLRQVVERYRRDRSRRRFLPDPGVDIVGDQDRIQPVEIAEARATSEQRKRDEANGRGLRLATADRRRHRSGDRSAASHSAASAIGRRRVGARLDFFRARIGMPLNADDGENDHRCGFILRIGAAEPHDAPFVRKFDDVAHRAILCRSARLPPFRAGRHSD